MRTGMTCAMLGGDGGGGEDWTRYLQDGLICQIDGEAAAKSGTVKDLISGYEATLPTGDEVTGKKIEVKVRQAFKFFETEYIGNRMTIEVVAAMRDSNTTAECFIESQRANQGFRLRRNAYFSAMYLGSYTNIVSSDVDVVYSIGMVWNGNSITRNTRFAKYLFGEFLGNMTADHQMTDYWNGHYSVGRIGLDNYTTLCDIYSIRMYNRALSAAEIAANYAIDKERFGLA